MGKCNNSNIDKTPTEESLIQNIRNVIGAQERFIKLCEQQQPTSDKVIKSTAKRPQSWWNRFLTLMKLNRKT